MRWRPPSLPSPPPDLAERSTLPHLASPPHLALPPCPADRFFALPEAITSRKSLVETGLVPSHIMQAWAADAHTKRANADTLPSLCDSDYYEAESDEHDKETLDARDNSARAADSAAHNWTHYTSRLVYQAGNTLTLTRSQRSADEA